MRMETDRQSLDPNLASLSSLRKSNNDICITQFYPAWSLHALLRFCNFSYECNNSDINTSLGMALPHLQDGQYAYSLRMALEHIESRRQLLDEPSLSSMKSVAMVTNTSDSSESLEKVELQAEIITPPSSSNPNSNKYKASIETSPDMVMASHIDHITNIYNQYSKLSKNNIKDFYKSTTWIANLFIMGWVQLSYSLFRNDNDYVLSLTEKYEPYPNSTADELFNRLKEAYSELAARLEKYSGSLFKISKKKDKDTPKTTNTVNARRISDALLFGHLAIGLCNEEISVIIEKHPALMSFFTTICNMHVLILYNNRNNDSYIGKEYFSDPIISNKSKVLSWHTATNQILNNKFLTLSKCKKGNSNTHYINVLK